VIVPDLAATLRRSWYRAPWPTTGITCS